MGRPVGRTAPCSWLSPRSARAVQKCVPSDRKLSRCIFKGHPVYLKKRLAMPPWVGRPLLRQWVMPHARAATFTPANYDMCAFRAGPAPGEWLQVRLEPPAGALQDGKAKQKAGGPFRRQLDRLFRKSVGRLQQRVHYCHCSWVSTTLFGGCVITHGGWWWCRPRPCSRGPKATKVRQKYLVVIHHLLLACATT